MKEISNLNTFESDLLSELQELFSHMRLAGDFRPGELTSSLEILKSLRQLIYENMNQLLHEALALKTIRFLQSAFYPNLVLSWFNNPKQTGGGNEPDIQARIQEKVIASAEITSSIKPAGAIDSRMSYTLKKLSEMAGDKFYVVATEAMERRAKSKIQSFGYQINVLRF